jgi:hypothetical protein
VTVGPGVGNLNVTMDPHDMHVPPPLETAAHGDLEGIIQILQQEQPGVHYEEVVSQIKEKAKKELVKPNSIFLDTERETVRRYLLSPKESNMTELHIRPPPDVRPALEFLIKMTNAIVEFSRRLRNANTEGTENPEELVNLLIFPYITVPRLLLLKEVLLDEPHGDFDLGVA